MPEYPDSDDDAYSEAVALALESNQDQPGYDEASAMAAVDAMLMEESGSIKTVLARLRGEQ